VPTEPALEYFGRVLIAEVRDATIEKYEMIADGTLKSDRASELKEKLALFSDEQEMAVRELVVSAVDDAIHNLLWMLEENADEINLTCRVPEAAEKKNVSDLSDGLCGELYSQDGWIARFSAYETEGS